MDNALFYSVSVLFMLGTILTSVLALRSRSPMRFFVPVTVLLSIGCAYLGIDMMLGQAMPVGLNPLWHTPDIKGGGATVLGGKIDGDVAILLLQEAGVQPRLYRFEDAALVRALKTAMQAHAKSHGGQPFGFKMTDGHAGAGQPGTARPGQGGSSGTGQGDSHSNFRFAEPVQEPMPPKV